MSVISSKVEDRLPTRAARYASGDLTRRAPEGLADGFTWNIGGNGSGDANR